LFQNDNGDVVVYVFILQKEAKLKEKTALFQWFHLCFYSYQKFTKGKDLSLKSKTDLHCVMGKRKPKPEVPSSPHTQSEVGTLNS